MEPLGGGVWGGVVLPLGLAYVGFVVMLFVYSRSERPDRKRTDRPAAWSSLVKHLAATAAAGYLIFLAIVLVFSFMFADQEGALRQAVIEGGYLVLAGLVALAFLGWVEGRLRVRRRDRHPRSEASRG